MSMQPFYLETWIHQIAASVLGTPGPIIRADLEQYQLLRLRQTVQRAFEKSSFYREHFEKAGVSPDQIRSVSDLERIPFTEPRHLSEMPYRLLCVSLAEVARPHSFVTSGTTGPPKKVFWSRSDLDRIIEFMAAGIATVATHADVVQIMLADGRPYSQADLLFRGVEKIGALPVLCSVDLGAEELLDQIHRSGSTVLFGYTGRLSRISKELAEVRDLRGTPIKVLFLAGEYLPDAARRQLENLWNCRVHTHYGLTEMGLGVAVECGARAGYHFNEAGLLLEVIDPATGAAVPAGEEGELVFTTLTREAMPLIRYRTHDISRLIPEPCPCGADTLLRFGSVRKRLESIFRLDGGDELYPALLDDILFEIPGLIDYSAQISRQQEKHRLELRVEVVSPDLLPEVYRKLLSVPVIARNIANGNITEPGVVPARPGELAGDRKKRFVVSG